MITGEHLTSTAKKTKVTFYYTSPVTYLSLVLIFLPAGILLVLIIALTFSKKMKLELSLSPSVKRKRVKKFILSAFLSVLSILFAIVSAQTMLSLFIATSGICAIAACVVAILSRYKVKCIGYKNKYFKIEGVHENFLQYCHTAKRF